MGEAPVASGAQAVKDTADSLREQKRLHPSMKPRVTEQITMIVPGRRALGETWSRVTIGHDGADITVAREDAAAPADGNPIVVLAGADAGYASYIMEAALEKAQERAVAPQALTPQEIHQATNAAWQAFIEDKLRWMKGQTTIGPGGMMQRQKIYQNPATRPVHH